MVDSYRVLAHKSWAHPNFLRAPGPARTVADSAPELQAPDPVAVLNAWEGELEPQGALALNRAQGYDVAREPRWRRYEMRMDAETGMRRVHASLTPTRPARELAGRMREHEEAGEGLVTSPYTRVRFEGARG